MSENEPRKNPDELGALWEKTNDRGTYMTGTIGTEKVVCFRNERKTRDTQPDWRVLKSKPRGEAQAKPMWGRTPPDRPNDEQDEDPDGLI